jgi:hypothetical protein
VDKKQLLLTLRPAGLIGIGLLLAAASAMLAGPTHGAASLASGALQATPTPTPVSEVGSTDWITLVSIIIVLIVIIPILIRRRSWDHP